MPLERSAGRHVLEVLASAAWRFRSRILAALALLVLAKAATIAVPIALKQIIDGFSAEQTAYILPVFMLIAYALLLERTGYLLTTGLFAAYLFALLAETRRRWWAIVAGAVATAVVTYLVFDRAFSVQLPKGLFGL